MAPPSPPRRSPRRESVESIDDAGDSAGGSGGGGGSRNSTPGVGRPGGRARTPTSGGKSTIGESILENLEMLGSSASPRPPSSATSNKRRAATPSSAAAPKGRASGGGASWSAPRTGDRRSSPRRKRGAATAASPEPEERKETRRSAAAAAAADIVDGSDSSVASVEEVKVVEGPKKGGAKDERKKKKPEQDATKVKEPTTPERRATRSRAKRDHDEGGINPTDEVVVATNEKEEKAAAANTKPPKAKKQKTAGGTNNGGKGRGGRGKGASKSSLPTLQQQTKAARMREATERLLSRTRYEVEVDPYRGIYDGRFGFHPPAPLRPIDEGVGASEDVPTPPPPTNPWGGCGGCCTEVGGPNGDGPDAASQLGVMRLNPMNAEDFLGEEDGDAGEKDDDQGPSKLERVIASAIVAREENANIVGTSNNDAVQEVKIPLVPECLCESRSKWANDAADAEMKRVKKARDKKKAAKDKGRRSGGGGGGSGSSANTRNLKRQRSNNMSSTMAGTTDEEDGDVVLVDADAKTNSKQDGDLQVIDEGDESGDDAASSNKIQVSVMPVRRNPDPSFCCPCDYNPLCLSSLGGAIDDLIHHTALERAREELDRAADVCGDSVVLADYTGAGPGKAAGTGTTMAAQEDGIARLRKSLPIEIESIRRHLTEVVHPYATDDDGMQLTERSIDECIDMIQQTHKGLIYENIDEPSSQDHTEDDESNSCIRLSTPPGLRNLGATCYLNSQFQCLAQNPAFVDGVFSWIGGGVGSSAGGSSRMDQVLLTMQTLLAEMNHGAENVVCTEPFGNALGLEHGEMQDPNEFARLLFDRMHESFQKSALAVAAVAASNGGSGPSSGGDYSATALAELLPNMFRGVCTYETKCEECNTTSERSENFMELTLPLVKPGDFRINKESSLSRSARPSQDGSAAPSTTIDTKSKSKKNKGRGRKSSKGSVTDSSVDENDAGSKANPQDSRDVTVQGCLDAYLFPEMLEDDNQFYCTSCAKKCDAVRSVSLSQLPPVLNILIARYVFDRLTFMKKKLSDRVLLPRTLSIPRKRTNARNKKDKGTEDAIYVLCAIQNHRGASAYGGHYVAEAMDWTTGVWYDYNDEEVTLLPSGPNCSYVPAAFTTASSPVAPIAAASGGKMKKVPPLRGSSDAYSLFYVERSFLAETASKLILRGSVSTLSAIEANTIARMAQQREARYREVTEMSLEKQRTNNRLERRRREIEGQLFDVLRKNSKAKSTSPPVWVNGKVLLPFLSCLDGMDVVLQQKPLLQNRDLVCSHGKGGLHPRVARSGKLLPRYIYDIIESLLHDEKEQIIASSSNEEAKGTAKRGKQRSGGGQQNKIVDITDLAISPDSSLFCPECVESYRLELAAKERALSLVLSLHEDLDGKCNDFDPKALPEGQNIFAVSRNFVTVFKKHAERVMKEASSPQVVCEGIDLLDLSFLPTFQSEVKVEETSLSSASDCMIIEKEKVATETVPPVGEPLDPKVNGKISCGHGRSNVLKYKKSVRYVPAEVWAKLLQLFPDAIPFRRFRRRSEDDNDEIEELCNDEEFDGKCAECELEKAGSSELLEKLQEWGQKVISDRYVMPPKSAGQEPRCVDLRELYSFRPTPENPIRKSTAFTCLCFRIVYRDSVQAWRSAIDVAQALHRNKKKGKGAVDEAKQKIIALAPWTFKSILCQHKLVPLLKNDIDKLVLGALCGTIKNDKLYNKELLRQVEIMTSDDYHFFIKTLKELRSIVLSEETPETSGDAEDGLSMPVLESYHPEFKFGVDKTVHTPLPGPFRFSALQTSPSPGSNTEDAPTVWVLSNPESCQCTVCLDGFVAAALALAPSPFKAGAQDVAIIDPPDDGQVDIRVHELDGSVELDAALSVLAAEINTAPSAGDGAEKGGTGTRRSSRKRKTRTDGIATHEFRLFPQDNLAKLKLLLLERANKKLFNQQWRLVSVRSDRSSPPPATDGEPTSPVATSSTAHFLSTTELGNDEKPLCDYFADTKTSGNDDTDALDAEEQCRQEKTLHLILQYRDEDGGLGNDGNGRKSRRLTAEEKEERQKAEDSLMAALTDMANVPDIREAVAGADQGTRSRPRRRRREERGFRGTFLHGLSPPPNAEEGTFTPKEFSPGASPKAAMSECIVLDDSPKKKRSQPPLPQLPSDSQPQSSSAQPQTAATTGAPGPTKSLDSCAHADESSVKKQRPTPPLQDANDIIVIDDEDDDAIDEIQSQRTGEPANEAKATLQERGANSNTDTSRRMDRSTHSSEFSAAEGSVYDQQYGVYDLSDEALNFTRPIYAPSAPEIVDEDGTHLCCGLTSTDRHNVMDFVDAMKKKPSSFWQNDNVEFEAMKAFSYHLPKKISSKHARHLYRNFADIPPKSWKWNCACKQEKKLLVSRRELDIMLYFVIKELRARDCHEYMPYRNERDLRHVFDTVKKCHRDRVFNDIYTHNVVVAVERIVFAEKTKQDETS